MELAKVAGDEAKLAHQRKVELANVEAEKARIAQHQD